VLFRLSIFFLTDVTIPQARTVLLLRNPEMSPNLTVANSLISCSYLSSGCPDTKKPSTDFSRASFSDSGQGEQPSGPGTAPVPSLLLRLSKQARLPVEFPCLAGLPECRRPLEIFHVLGPVRSHRVECPRLYEALQAFFVDEPEVDIAAEVEQVFE